LAKRFVVEPATEVVLVAECSVAYSSKHLLGVVFLSSVKCIIDESEAGRSATTELGLKAENRNVLILGLHGLRELSLDVFL